MILDASLVLDTFRILGSATAVTSSLLIPKSVMGLEAVLDTAEVVLDSIISIFVANSFSFGHTFSLDTFS